MAAFTEPGIQEVWIRACSQIGKTELVLNVAGYFAHQDPSPVLMVQPTIEMAESFSKERLAPMVRDTPVLRDLLPDPKSRNSGNTLRKKEFPGGYWQLAGANSPAGLAMRPIRILLLDEQDRYPQSAGAEGDVFSIAKKRTATFWNRLIIVVSSPTEKGLSRIEAGEAQTDQRRYYVTCPHCGHAQILTWAHVVWDKTPEHRPDTAAIQCEACKTRWTEGERQSAIRQAMRQGWRATRRADRPGIAGFHLSELVSMWRTPVDMAYDWLAAQGDTERLKTFVNTSLGESFSIPADELDPLGYFKRRELYPHVIPNGSHLTAAVDVQDNRLELEIVAWGEGEENWAIEYRILRGSPTQRQVWDLLEQTLNQPRYRIDGTGLDILIACIDSGHLADEVYAFCRRNPQRFIPTKGSSQGNQPIASFPRVPNKERVHLTAVGTDTAKGVLFDRLKLASPGPGFCHWPMTADFDEEYFRQLCSEKRERRLERGRPVFRWVPLRHRNEALDIRVLGLAAVRLLQHPDLGRARLENLAPDWQTKASGIGDSVSHPVTGPSAQPATRRRTRRGLFD